MKIRSKKNVKPWDNISIDEILPYNPRYTKEIILSYIFIVVFLVDHTDWFQLYNPFLIFAFIGIYGVIAFSFLSLGTNRTPKKVLNDFISFGLFFITILIIIDTITFLISGSGNFKDLMGENILFSLFALTLWYLRMIFIGITCLLGPFTLLMTKNPKTELHGLITTFAFEIALILTLVFHI
ncbi:hypothetical protein [uncultured Methanobacterium sp.]|uniref:hypothetical protein n=1 Tax=uncultured Methanobacterium sp. TaxID=176306 RepID=UPI002AA8E5BA|nr:hypothetical protein [uncultured Methanobacterium sp.]